ncbi:hypothetical protein OAL27_02180 [Verrucomicrobiales bacterium]|nr:hypothetical protein [Verrucomicrobiales bacterium]
MALGSAERVGWIDTLKVLAGILMLIDHSAVFVGGVPDWVRLYATRCVEPLYAFAFFYLLSLRGKRIRLRRWLSLVVAAAAECLIFSWRYETLTFGILANLAVVAPLFESIRRKGIGTRAATVCVSGALSALPLSFSGVVAIDYGVPLLLSQGLIAHAAFLRADLFRISLSQFGGLLLGICLARIVGLGLSPNCLTVLVGQPVAMTLIATLRGLRLGRPIGLAARIIVGHPLTFYLGHLALLAAVAWVYRNLMEPISAGS